MKTTLKGLTLCAAILAPAAIAGEHVIYEVNGQPYEGYWLK